MSKIEHLWQKSTAVAAAAAKGHETANGKRLAEPTMQLRYFAL